MKKFLLALALLAVAPSLTAMEGAVPPAEQESCLLKYAKKCVQLTVKAAQSTLDTARKAGTHIKAFCDGVDRKLDQMNERAKKRHAMYWQLLRKHPLRLVKVYLQDTIHDLNRVADVAIILAPLVLWYAQTHPEIFGLPPTALKNTIMADNLVIDSPSEDYSYGSPVGVLGTSQLPLNATFVPRVRDFVLG